MNHITDNVILLNEISIRDLSFIVEPKFILQVVEEIKKVKNKNELIKWF